MSMAFELHPDDRIDYEHSNSQTEVFSDIMSSLSLPSSFRSGECYAQQRLSNQHQVSFEWLSQDTVDPNTVFMLNSANYIGNELGVS
jgi:hypothetical protein